MSRRFKHTNYKKSFGGFTIVELLITIAVIGILTTSVATFFTNGLLDGEESFARNSQQQEIERTLDIMTNDIRLSANADLNNRWPDAYSPGAPTNEFSWQSDSDTLILATAVENTSGDIVFSDPHNYISAKNNLIYFVSGGTLYKRTLAANETNNAATTSCPSASATPTCPADKELLHNVTDFAITYLDGTDQSVTSTNARSIEVHLATSKQVFSRTISADYTTRMVFRND